MKIQWMIDFPDPRNLLGEWINVASFDRKREAVAFIERLGISRRYAGLFISRVEV